MTECMDSIVSKLLTVNVSYTVKIQMLSSSSHRNGKKIAITRILKEKKEFNYFKIPHHPYYIVELTNIEQKVWLGQTSQCHHASVIINSFVILLLSRQTQGVAAVRKQIIRQTSA